MASGLHPDVIYEAEPDHLNVRIRPTDSVAVLVATCAFFTVWLGGWTYGIVAIASHPLEAGLLTLVWLCGAVVAWSVVAGLWLWLLVGYEEIDIRHRVLRRGFHVLRFRRYQLFDTDSIQRLRAAGLFGGNRAQLGWWGIGDGVIALEVEGKTHRWCANLDEDQAVRLVERMKRYLPPGA